MCRYRQPGIVAVLTQNHTEPLAEDKAARATAEVEEHVGGRVFTGVDPGHGRAGAAQWQPLVLHDATTPASTASAGHP